MRDRTTITLAAVAATIYIAAIVAANAATARFGLIPVGFGLLTTAGTYAAGLALVARNLTQDAAGRLVAIAAMIVGVALSVVLATPQLALASGAAFAVSESLDMAVYTPLRRRDGWWARALLPASILGAVADSLVFLTFAGFPLWPTLLGQLVGKGWAIAIPVALAVAARYLFSRRSDAAAEGV